MSITIIRSIIIYLFVIAAIRIMGKRQIGELKPQELVITILISSVATIPLEANSIPLANSFLPIMIFISLSIIESALSMKSVWFRDLLQGKPIFIIKNSTLRQKELSRLRFTVDDLLDGLRQQGVFDISTVENAIIETNGSLSVQLKAEKEPTTREDFNIEAKKNTIPVPIVMDGSPILEYFGSNKINENEISLITKSAGENTSRLMLFTIDDSGDIYSIEKEEK